MSPRLKISSYVLERLCRMAAQAGVGGAGCVYGLMYDNTLLVVGAGLARDVRDREQLLLHVPTEVELCGAVCFGQVQHTDPKLKDIIREVDTTDNPLVLSASEDGQLKAHFLVHERLEESMHEVLDAEELWRQFVHVRLRTVLPLACEATVTGVKNALQAKRKKIASGQVSFHLEGSSVYMLGETADVGMTPTNGEPTLGQLLHSMSPEQHKKKRSHGADSVEVVPVNILIRRTKDIMSEKNTKKAVKMVTTQGKPSYCISMPLVLDGLAMVHREARLPQLYSVLVECACRSLRLLEHSLIDQLGQEGMGDGAGLRMPDTYHFLPPELGHFLTRILPRGLPEEATELERRQLHEQLGLRVDRPVFRRGNAFPLKRPVALLSPHEALPPPPPGIQTALVRGRYTYHHYMQDQIDDNGWGCAYRSLQTLCSWFRMQGYTTEAIPTHRDIQRCLVDIGDKPASFVGSRQWIGSTEVSFCLETLLGVHSRIIFANVGAGLVEYVPELLHHFHTHGSPIMIGGGVLAHTILGVQYSPDTRDARYLILDPHYCGVDELAPVLAKGWCGWKTSDFWDKTAHYNLCLPQTRPCL